MLSFCGPSAGRRSGWASVAGRPSEALQLKCVLLDRFGAAVAARASARFGGLPAAPADTPLDEVGTSEVLETGCLDETSATADVTDGSEPAPACSSHLGRLGSAIAARATVRFGAPSVAPVVACPAEICVDVVESVLLEQTGSASSETDYCCELPAARQVIPKRPLRPVLAPENACRRHQRLLAPKSNRCSGGSKPKRDRGRSLCAKARMGSTSSLKVN